MMTSGGGGGSGGRSWQILYRIRDSSLHMRKACLLISPAENAGALGVAQKFDAEMMISWG
jgi:hypothetical protein